jgi:hypothetical protein
VPTSSPSSDAVDFAEEVLKDIISNIDDKNVEELLRQAEYILENINAKNFYDAKMKSEEELDKALLSKCLISVLGSYLMCVFQFLNKQRNCKRELLNKPTEHNLLALTSVTFLTS